MSLIEEQLQFAQVVHLLFDEALLCAVHQYRGHAGQLERRVPERVGRILPAAASIN